MASNCGQGRHSNFTTNEIRQRLFPGNPSTQQCRCNYSTDIYYRGVCLKVSACFSSAPSISPSLSSFHKIYSTGRAQRRLLISLKSSCLTPGVETAHGRERGKCIPNQKSLFLPFRSAKQRATGQLAESRQNFTAVIECRCDRDKWRKRSCFVQAVLINLNTKNTRYTKETAYLVYITL